MIQGVYSMKKFYKQASLELKNKYNIDVVDDILLGKKDRVLLYADVTHKNDIVFHVISNHLNLIGLPDLESISLDSIIGYIDFDNRYAEVAGLIKYKKYIIDSLFNFDDDMNITFPIIYQGQRTWVHFDGFKVEKNPNIYVCFASDFSKLMAHEEVMYEKTHKDALTHLFNKYTFDYHYGLRYQWDNIHILYLDLDDFKIINDTYGHNVGNQVLQNFAQMLTSYETDINRFYRLGGDEFIGMHFGETKHILHMAEDILERTQKVHIPKHHKPITVSIGIVKGTLREEMVRKADDLLYQAKNNGKNQIVFEVES